MTRFHQTYQDKNNETYTTAFDWSETLYIRPEGISQITDYLYGLLGCTESQTKPIIKKFLAYIISEDKKHHAQRTGISVCCPKHG